MSAYLTGENAKPNTRVFYLSGFVTEDRRVRRALPLYGTVEHVGDGCLSVAFDSGERRCYPFAGLYPLQIAGDEAPPAPKCRASTRACRV